MTAAAIMTPRERVRKAIAYEQPDRIPHDFAAIPEVGTAENANEQYRCQISWFSRLGNE